MQISTIRLRLLRDEYASDVLKRGSLENDVELIRISALISNNAGFTVYNSFPTFYEETYMQKMVASLQTIFIDSLITTNSLEDGKTCFTIDWSSEPTFVKDFIGQTVIDGPTESTVVDDLIEITYTQLDK
jgi:hypothetical protein